MGKNKKKIIVIAIASLTFSYFSMWHPGNARAQGEPSMWDMNNGNYYYDPTTGKMTTAEEKAKELNQMYPPSGSSTYSNQEKIPGAPKQTDNFVDYIKQIIRFGFAAIGILALFMLSVGAYQYLMAAGNLAKVDSAKETISSALLGLILGLTAFLILRTINPQLVNLQLQSPGGGTGGGTGTTTGGAPYTGPTGSGDCSPWQGACSQENTACFGQYAQTASAICGYESAGGNPNIPSSTDKCQNGQSFSIGLWQINMISHGDKFGCNPSEIFSGGTKGECLDRRGKICYKWSCQVINEQKYDECVQKLKDPALNTQLACSMFNANKKTLFSDWENTRDKCFPGGVK